jgi:hypothetical protein
VEAARRDLTREVEGVPWDEPWPDTAARPSLLAARGFFVRCRRAPAWIGLLAMIENFVVTWDDPDLLPDRGPRRRIYERDGWRCMAPGCTSRKHLEDHHLEYLSRGGDEHAPDNQLCTCGFHHRMGEHGGLAQCRGKAPLDVVWRLGREEVGVRYRNERRLDLARTAG